MHATYGAWCEDFSRHAMKITQPACLKEPLLMFKLLVIKQIPQSNV